LTVCAPVPIFLVCAFAPAVNGNQAPAPDRWPTVPDGPTIVPALSSSADGGGGGSGMGAAGPWVWLGVGVGCGVAAAVLVAVGVRRHRARPGPAAPATLRSVAPVETLAIHVVSRRLKRGGSDRGGGGRLGAVEAVLDGGYVVEGATLPRAGVPKGEPPAAPRGRPVSVWDAVGGDEL
jgi:hypothetical protein